MSMTDPIADMLTRIRNAIMVKKEEVRMPSSKIKKAIGETLVEEGYLKEVREEDIGNNKKELICVLKYSPEGESVITEIVRKSKPGRRIYIKAKDMKPVLNGYGIAIISTSKGIMSDRKCRRERLGGELICTVW